MRTDLLRRSDTTSYCNYKGYATYWSAGFGDDPLPETLPIKRYFSFDATRADVLAELPESPGASGCGCDL